MGFLHHKHLTNRRIILGMVFFLLVLSSLAQEQVLYTTNDSTTPRIFNQEDLSRLNQQKEYQYQPYKEGVLIKLLRKIFDFLKVDDERNTSQNAPLIIGLILLTIIISIIVIRYKPMSFFLRGDRAFSSSTTEHERVLPASEVFNQELQIKLQQQDYKTAVHLYYEELIRRLGNQKFIQIKPYKTHEDYLREFPSGELKNEFSNLSKWYVYIWYGDHPINETQYEHLAFRFSQILRQLPQG